MAKSWEILNNDDDNLPEIVLTTDGTNGEKFILRNILRGVYGFPYVHEGTVENGMSSRIVLKFKPFDMAVFSTSKTLDNLQIIPSWSKKSYVVSKVQHAYAQDPMNENQQLGYDANTDYNKVDFMYCRRQRLFLSFPFFELVPNFDPTKIIVERYHKGKWVKMNYPVSVIVGKTPKGGKAVKKEKVKVVGTTDEEVSTAVKSYSNLEVRFSAERYFRAFHNYINAKGMNRTSDTNASVILRFRYETTIDDKLRSFGELK